jgi:hypothetical protein
MDLSFGCFVSLSNLRSTSRRTARRFDKGVQFGQDDKYELIHLLEAIKVLLSALLKTVFFEFFSRKKTLISKDSKVMTCRIKKLRLAFAMHVFL